MSCSKKAQLRSGTCMSCSKKGRCCCWAPAASGDWCVAQSHRDPCTPDLTTHWPLFFLWHTYTYHPLATGGSDTEIPSTKKHVLFTKRDATDSDWRFAFSRIVLFRTLTWLITITITPSPSKPFFYCPSKPFLISPRKHLQSVCMWCLVINKLCQGSYVEGRLGTLFHTHSFC